MNGERSAIDLNDYRDAIALDEPWQPPAPAEPDEVAALQRKVLEHLRSESSRVFRSDPVEELRARVTVRPPGPLPADIQDVLDRLLAAERDTKGVVRASELRLVDQGIALWRGDITRLQVDAVTNAANSALLGCFRPFHPCIDNVLHWQAGPRMRADCDTIMRLQGRDEPTGAAKITRAYNLPARFVLHTVGPIVTRRVEDEHRDQLASCYTSCLDLAQRMALRTVAFCAVSTGVFGYPSEPAAETAVRTVRGWLSRNAGHMRLVIFDVFTDADEAAYVRAFEATDRRG
jgi:O-acetyl-ADP-ribose deacetylase (regulator of RNase III)